MTEITEMSLQHTEKELKSSPFFFDVAQIPAAAPMMTYLMCFDKGIPNGSRELLNSLPVINETTTVLCRFPFLLLSVL